MCTHRNKSYLVDTVMFSLKVAEKYLKATEDNPNTKFFDEEIP